MIPSGPDLILAGEQAAIHLIDEARAAGDHMPLAAMLLEIGKMVAAGKLTPAFAGGFMEQAARLLIDPEQGPPPPSPTRGTN